MKQIIVLQEQEIRRLQKGKTLLISTPGGEQLGIQFEEDSGPGVLTCDICGATTNGIGKPVASERGVEVHKRKLHKDGRRK
jgi:hypothetical protein